MTTTFAQPQTYVPSAAWQQTPWNLFGGYQSVGVKQQGVETPAGTANPMYNNNPLFTNNPMFNNNPLFNNNPYGTPGFSGVPFSNVPFSGVPFGAIPFSSIPQFYQNLAGQPTGLGSCFGACNVLGQTSPIGLGTNWFATTPAFTPSWGFNPSLGFNPSFALNAGFNLGNSFNPFTSPIGACSTPTTGTPSFGNFNPQAFQPTFGATPFGYSPSAWNPILGTLSPVTQAYNWNSPLAGTFASASNLPFNNLPFNNIPFSNVPFGTVPSSHSSFSTVPFGGSLHNTVPFGTVPFNSIPFGASQFNTVPFTAGAFNTSPFSAFALSGQFGSFAGSPSAFGTPSGIFGLNPWTTAIGSSPIGAWNAWQGSPLLQNTLNPYACGSVNGFGTTPISSFVPGYIPTYANGFVNPMQGFVPTQANTQIDNGKMGGLNLNNQAA